ncbi:MAG: hypothetical protein A2289_12190 [Deltaproteobacteria bacterium RIFOXYA12_FULL_58_15]|nr:MAG: hypothetical protein A2289_12190 [Deltaproteobacteria bacterium RIFOXYA12_FULL_58_15]
MRRFLLSCVVSLMVIAGTLPVAAKVKIKLGTAAPDGSSWHLGLKEMAAEWEKVSNGEVVLKIYPGGVAGNEGDMVRKMRIGQLHAAALTVVGLHDIYAAPQAIAAPGVIANEAEWGHVFRNVTPTWEKAIDDMGFVVIMWGDTGWLHMFFRKQVKTPADTRDIKVFAWAGDPASVEAAKLAGFRPVVISSTDILPSLSTGMIDGFGTTPIIAVTARWYEQAPHMVATPWGHLPAATVVSKTTWEKIPSDLRPKLMEIARKYAAKSNADVMRMEADAIAAMKKNGLKVVEFDAAGKIAWQKVAESTWPAVRGGVVSEEEFDLILKIRDEFRANQK